MDVTGVEAVIVPIVNVLTGVFKMYGVNSKLLPVVALVLGTLAGLALQPDLFGAVEGLVAGWGAIANYAMIKTVSQ